MADITVFRMHSTAYAATDTTGAMLAGGRWHSRGTRVLYAAEHVSLALLETLIHSAGRKLPPRSLTRIAIPDGVPIESTGWRDQPQSGAFGDAWVREARSAVLRVPSIAVNGLEGNFVFNPAHPAFARIRFELSESFALDSRYILLP